MNAAVRENGRMSGVMRSQSRSIVTFSMSFGPPTPADQAPAGRDMWLKLNALSLSVIVGVDWRMASLIDSARFNFVLGSFGSAIVWPVTAKRVAWLTPFSSER